MSTKLAGTLNVNNQSVINVPNPVNPLDAVNLQTLQGSISGALSYTAGENINSHTAVVFINNLLYKCDISNPLHQYSYIGFTQTSVLSGQSVPVITENTISLTGWGLTPNSYYQLSLVPGGITIIEPIGSLFKQVVGYSETTDTLLLLRNNPILTT